MHYLANNLNALPAAPLKTYIYIYIYIVFNTNSITSLTISFLRSTELGQVYQYSDYAMDGGSGVQCLASTNIFLFSQVSDWLCVHQASYSAYQQFFTLPQLTKQLQHEADRSPLSRAVAENEGSCPSSPLVCLYSAA